MQNHAAVFRTQEVLDEGVKLIDAARRDYENIKISDRKEIKGWISRDQRIWGDDLREEDFD